MAEGQFFKAGSPQEACALLARHGGKARLLAGGTDLMVALNLRQSAPEVLVYIGDSGLSYIKAKGDNLIIGAGTAFSEILESAPAKETVPLLVETVSRIASVAIRNVGTIGGNLASASPAADSAIALLALGASLKLVSEKGDRTVPLAGFFTGPGQTLLKTGEMIQEIIIPPQPTGTRWAYRKLGKRKAQSISVVSAAICCQMNGNVCKEARIALGAVAPTPILAAEASALLEGKTFKESLIRESAKAAANATSPIDDVRGSAWYRRRATEALVKQLLANISA